MNFRPELAAAVMSSRKVVTRRLTSANPRSPWYEGGCSLVVGRDYAVCPGRGKPAVGRARIVAVDLVRLGHLNIAAAVREGFETVSEFEEAWAAINGTYDPNALVWRVELEAL